MLKNKFKIIIVLMLAILLLIVPIAKAENEISEGNITQNQTTNNDTTAENNLKKEDIYLTGDDVVIDYIVDGNLFVMADTVTINSQIGGDAFILSNNLTIGEQGYIFSNLFTVSKNITINGVVYDLYSVANNLSINGYIYRDMRVSSDNINILGTIGRNVYANCTNLNLLTESSENPTESTESIETSSHAVIVGNLNYSSTQEASIPSGTVNGKINFDKKEIINENIISTYIISLGTFVITIAAIWLICLWIAPKFLQNNTSLITTKKILPIIGLGILTPIVLVILSVLLLVLGITSTLGLLMLIALFVLIAISTSIFVITVNSVVCQKLKITKNVTIFGMVIISAIVLWLIGLIPYVGSIISLLAVILGLGIITYSLLFKNKKD